MERALVDILVLGLLLLLFAAIYHKRHSPRLRYWILGWTCILLHFVILLGKLSFVFLQTMAASMGLVMLLVAALFFMLAADRNRVGFRGVARITLLVAGPMTVYVFFTNFNHYNYWFLLLLAVTSQAGILKAVFELWPRRSFLVVTSVLAIATLAVNYLAIAEVENASLGVYAVLTELYLLNAILYGHDFRRRSIGVTTAVAGLAAWALVFPAALLLEIYLPQHLVAAEWWNVPKFFVEFGMILTLLEEEILYTGRQREQYRILFDGNPHPMWITDRITLDFLQVNEAAVLRYGYSESEFLQMNLRDLHHPDEMAAFERQFLDTVPEPRVSGPWTHVRKDGTRLRTEVASHGIFFEDHLGRFSLVQDVTERVELHDRLMHQANHDPLTGLPNRALLKDRMTQTLATAARRSTKVAVITLDLDRFKQINDAYGHSVGDLCLKKLADRLSSRLRASDTVARSGGEEFTVLLDGLSSSADAERVAAELLHEICLPFVAEEYTLQLSASIGIAMYPDDGTDPQDLWRASDVAMYRAKNSGGNQYLLVSPELSQAADEAKEIESYMRTCLREGGFELYYQGQHSCSGELLGLEALLRLSHPVLGEISPDRFIPIAEESGIIVQLGLWVLAEVCRQRAEWEQQGFGIFRIGINVSSLQFIRDDFAIQVKDVCSMFGVHPHFLEIEITETTMMRQLNEIGRQMTALAELGVSFAVDNFGTGYCSLRNLNELPIRTLKIDRSFIHGLTDEEGSYAMVEAMISMSHSLGLKIVAEGVESREQASILHAMECDVIQGFLYARPVPASEVLPVLSGGMQEPGRMRSQL